MRHGEVSYYDEEGELVGQEHVRLTDEGRAQAAAARDLLGGVRFDRVVTSGLPRTLETAEIVAPGLDLETWPELAELRGGDPDDLPPDGLEEEFLGAFRGVVPPERRFFGGESIDELYDRVLPVIEQLVADPSWDTTLAVLHGAVNRAILSHALTGDRHFLGHLEQAAGCLNVLDVGADGSWIVRAVGITPRDPIHATTRLTTMEHYWQEYLDTR
jgi:probable phosphoglycerate mutase